MTNEEKIEQIRQWNRYYPDHEIKLTLFDIYGTMAIRIYYENDQVAISYGNTLGKRLDFVLKWIASQED